VALGITPIKGFAMQPASEVTVTASGLVGDRAFFVLDEAGKLVSATRTRQFLPYWARFDQASGVLSIGKDGAVLVSERTTEGEPVRGHFFGDRYATGHVVPGPWSELLSDIAERPVRLVKAADPLGGYDVHRLSLVSVASVRALDGVDGAAPLDPRRFRMSLTVDGVAAFTEDTWAGRSLSLGGCVLRVTGPVRRCAAVQRHPDGLDSDADPLRRIKDVRGVSTSEFGRGLHLGVYADIEQPGVVRLGDALQHLDLSLPAR
jgi:uncharacterized protein YcbX